MVTKEKIRKDLLLKIFLLLVLAGGCMAHATPGALNPELTERIENEIRSRYSVPDKVDIAISSPQASDVPGYDKLVVTFTGGDKKNTFDFLISKDRKTLAHLELRRFPAPS